MDEICIYIDKENNFYIMDSELATAEFYKIAEAPIDLRARAYLLSKQDELKPMTQKEMLSEISSIKNRYKWDLKNLERSIESCKGRIDECEGIEKIISE